MATIQGLTKDRMLEIEAAAIVSGAVDETNHLILTKHDGSTIDTGLLQINGAETIRQNVVNNTGSTLLKGTAVYISGANGNHPYVSKARANTEATSSKTLGLIKSDIANEGLGQVVTEGIITGLNTSTALVGDAVWLSPDTDGGLVYGLVNKPTAPNHMVFIGVVIKANSTTGSIQIKVQNGFELNELHDVSVNGAIAGDLIVRNSSNTLWENVQTIPQESVDELTADLALKAPLNSPTFTGWVNLPNYIASQSYEIQPTPIARTSVYTLAIDDILNGLITAAGTATFSFTLPTGSSIDTYYSGNLSIDASFDWYVINTVAFTKTIAANSNHTFVGNATIAVNSSAAFRTRKTAANTFVTYRLT